MAMFHFPSPATIGMMAFAAKTPHDRAQPVALDCRSHGLWSLWDMLRIFGKPFVEASNLIGQLVSAIQDQKISSFNEKFRGEVTGILDRLIEQVDAIGLTMTKVSANRLRKQLQNPEFERHRLRHFMVELQSRLVDEMESTYLLSLSDKEKELYEPDLPLWSDVLIKFPSIAYEIDEAAKCLALGRSTASAFHSIRSLEAAIRALSRCLGISDPTRAADRSWFNMLNTIKDELDRRWPGTSNRMLGDGRFFEEAYAALAAMQNPYRNATMHLDQIYTEEGARDIFNAVGGFMKRIAARLDENGVPKA
jgi:hypothetical protein